MNKSALVREIMDWALHIAVAVLLGLFIVNFVAQITFVDGDSMLPTLQHRNILLVEKISPRFNRLNRGDIVTLNVPEIVGTEKKYIIKRIIGLENDSIEIKDGKVYVNGVLSEEPYINGNTTSSVSRSYSSVTVPKGQVYVLGDNRMPGKSLDSRSFGLLDLKKVMGKAILRLLPIGRFGTL